MKCILLISQSFYPAELSGIMASGRPVITIMSKNPGVVLTLNEFQCGLITPPKNVHALVENILQLRSNESGRKIIGGQASKH